MGLSMSGERASTAIVEAGARVGERTALWHFCHVMKGAQIGSDCVLGMGCFVAKGAQIGDRVRLQNHISVYEGVILEDDVFCGPSVVFTNVERPRAFLNRRHALGTTRIGRGATLGANCTVVCGVTVGAYAFVGAGAVVTQDVPAHALMVGVPAQQVGWVSHDGERLSFDEHGLARCPCSGAEYLLTAMGVALMKQMIRP
jgi:UDP-2-acetamido-3-amino-2,3-dideoxy-glucuronate N-acetyltransferase